MACDAVALVRFGAAADVARRLAELRLASPLPLRLLATMAAGPDGEAALRRRFRRLREHGQWYRAEGALLELVDSLREAR